MKKILLLLSLVFSIDLIAASNSAIPATDDGLSGAGPIWRYQWCNNLWERTHTGWAKRVKQDQAALVFQADSITQRWNEIVGFVKADLAHCTCNGEVFNAEFKVPVTDPIGLEDDRGQMENRSIRVKEIH